ncbi:MAG: hypothetical protein ACRBBU_04775 [Pseudooceanicola sp.]
MSSDRADLGFADALDDLDSWPVEPHRPAPAAPLRHETRATAERLGFPSRQAGGTGSGQGATPARQQRRRRTGRNAQFNLKAKPETIEAYCAIADAKGWGLGETLEYAVALMEEAYGPAPEDQGGKG